MSESTFTLLQNIATGTTTDIKLCNYTVNGFTTGLTGSTGTFYYNDTDLQVLNTEDFIDVYSAMKVTLKLDGITGSEQFTTTTGVYQGYTGTKTNTIQLLETSTSLVESQLEFTFTDGPTGSTVGNATILFATGATGITGGYNMFKAVNSALERSDNTNGISMQNSVTYNQNVSLLWDGPIVRDSTTNQLSGVTGYGVSGHQSKSFYDLSIPSGNSGNTPFIGALKFVQEDPTITVTENCDTTSTLQSITNAVTKSSKRTGLTGALSHSDFDALFSADNLSNVGDKYNISITGTTGVGGYSTASDSTFTLDYSAILQNQNYMFQCASAGWTGTTGTHQIIVENSTLTPALMPQFVNGDFLTFTEKDEQLGNTDSQSNIIVNIASTLSSDNSRASVTGASSFQKPDIYYSGDIGSPESWLSSSDCTTQSVSDTLTCLLPSTTLGALGSFALGATGQNIGATGIFASMYQSDSAINFTDLDTTFAYTHAGSTGYTSDQIVFMNIKSQYDITSTGVMTTANNIGITGVDISALINNNVDLRPFSQENSSSRLKLTTKTLSDLTAGPILSRSLVGPGPTGKIVLTSDSDLNIISSSDAKYGNLMDANIESMMGITGSRNTPVTLTVNYSTNGSASNLVGLTRVAVVSYVCSSYSGSLTYNESEMTYDHVQVSTSPPVQITSIPFGYVLPDNDTELYLTTEVKSYTVHIPLQWSCASNMKVQIPVTETTRFYSVKNTITGKFLPKKIVSKIAERLDVIIPIASRTFDGATNNALEYITNFQVKDLFLFKATIEMNDDDDVGVTGTGWSNLNISTATDLDVVYNSVSTIPMAVNLITCSAVVSISIPPSSSLGASADGFYICPLNTAKGKLSYEATGKVYTIANDAANFVSFNTYSSDVDDVAGGSKLTLSTNIRQVINASGIVTTTYLDVTDNYGYTYTFTQINPTMYCNFNILSCQTPLFRNVKTIPTGTSYMRGLSNSRVKVDEGVYANYDSTLQNKNQCVITLLAQKIRISLFTSYDGDYSALTTIADLETVEHDTVGAASSSVTIHAFRGASNISNLQLVRRSQGSFYFKVGDLIGATNGSSYLYNTAHYHDGAINLGITANHSHYTQNPSPVPITVAFDSYTINISNLDTTSVSTSKNVIWPFYYISYCAERVLLYSSESWSAQYNVPDLKVYYSTTYVGDPTNSFSWSPLDYNNTPLTYSYDDLKEGQTLPNNVAAPGLIDIKRIIIHVKESTSYLMCPPPQFRISAYCPYDIQSLPYDPSSVSPHTKYQDIITLAIPPLNPFSSDSQMNDFSIQFSAGSVTYYEYKYKTPAQNTAITFPIASNNLKIEYNLSDASGNYESIIPPTYVYNGSIQTMSDAGSPLSFDVTINDSTRLIDFTYSQPIDSILTGSTSDALNVKVKNIPYFGQGTGTLALETDNSIKVDIYGKTIDYTGIRPVITFSKYTVPSIDYKYLFETYLEASTCEISFTATSLSTFTKTLPFQPLTSSPFNMTEYINANLPTDASFNPVSTFTPKTLGFHLEAISRTGLAQMNQILAVTNGNMENVLLLNRPDITNVKRPDGTSVYRVTADGFVIANQVAANTLVTSSVSLITNASTVQNNQIVHSIIDKDNSDNIV